MSSGLSTGSGTLGCYLVNEAYPDLFMLSNNHVLAAENRARAGDPVIQGKAPALAQLFRFPLLANYERSDCAVARLLNRGHEGGTSPNAVKAIIDVFAPPQDLGQWIGTETADCAIAIAPLPGSSLPALVALHIDAPAGENRGYLRVGRGLQNSGIVSQWSNAEPIGGWFGKETQAAGLAIADLDGNGTPDAVVFHIDNPPGANNAFYRIGRDLQANGRATWGNPIQIPGWWATECAGGGIALADVTGSGRLDLVVLFVDAPAGENQAYIRIGEDLDPVTGQASWTRPPQPISAWWGADTQGADIAHVGLDADGNQQFVVAHVDAPQGENRLYYRTIAIDRSGALVQARDAFGVPVPFTGHSAGAWIGGENQGLGVAVTNFGGRDSYLFALTIDNPPGENHAHLHVARALLGTSRMRWGAPVSATTRVALPGIHVWKSGATTEVLHGEITAVSANLHIAYPAAGTTWLAQTVVIEPAISDAGDSGSLVFDGNGTPVALIHSGSVKVGLSGASHIDAVLEDLRISSPYAVPRWTGAETQGAGIASVTWSGSSGKTTDLVIVHVDNPPGENQAFFRVGKNVDINGQVRGGWLAPQRIGGWIGTETQAAGATIARFRGEALPSLVMLHVDHAAGGNRAYLYLGRGFDQNGNVSQQFKGPIPLEWNGGNIWFGTNCQGADVAVADLGSGQLSIILLNIDSPGGGNRGYYRVGHDFRADGSVGSWEDWREIPGGFGLETGDAGIAVTNLDSDKRPELIVFHVDQAGSSNLAYYRVGWNLDKKGMAARWSAPVSIGKWWGDQTQGAGVTIADLTGSGYADMILLNVDNPAGENTAYYRVVYDVMPSGEPARWRIA